jgi:NTP pyrophosphatase (non-canonical NTP hydrolase)
LLELFRFKNQDDQVALLQDTETRAEIEDELADSLFFLLRFADLNNIDLEEALTTKLEKNRSRYPVDESHSSNEKYDQ